MTRGRWLAVLALGFASVAAAITASSMLGRAHAFGNLAFVDVSATTAARAMHDDHFFSDYGDKILVIHGTVASVQSGGRDRQIFLRTDGPFGLTCTVAASSAVGQPVVGAVITVVAPGGSAQREPSSVNLSACRVMSAL